MKIELVQAVANNCKSLQVLNLAYWKYGASLQPVWCTTVALLIKLAGAIPVAEFTDIGNHWKNLEELRLKNIENLLTTQNRESLYELLETLKSLGIIYLSFTAWIDDDFGAIQLRSLLSRCFPNVGIYLSIGKPT